MTIANTKRQMILKKGKAVHDGPVDGYDFTRATTIKRMINGVNKFLNRHGRQLDNLLVTKDNRSRYFVASSVGTPDVVFYYFYDAYGYRSHVYVGWNKIETWEFLRLPADEQDEMLSVGQTLNLGKLWNRERSLELLINAIKTLPNSQANDVITGPVGVKITNAVGNMMVTDKDVGELGIVLKYLKELATPEAKKMSSDLRKIFKRAALKDLLDMVKRNSGHNYRYLNDQIVNGIKLLKSKGGDWPELDLILKRVTPIKD